MNGQAIVYTLATLINLANLFLQVFFTINFSDLEADFINPIDLCNRLNAFILPEALLQLSTAVLFLLTGHWLSFLLNVPIAYANLSAVYKNQYLLDATEIFRTLGKHKTSSFMKLAFHLLIFFFYLYSLIVSLLGSDVDGLN